MFIVTRRWEHELRQEFHVPATGLIPRRGSLPPNHISLLTE